MEKISILMGIYNCADTLPRAIDSMIAQTYTDWELILCDDGSTDDTYAVAEEYAKKEPRIVLIRNEKNIKLAATLNHCLEHATGKYIARMDGDDESTPDRFEKQIAYLKANPDVDLVGGAVTRSIDGKGYLLKSVQNPTKYTLRNIAPFHHATILTYKYVFDKVGGYTVAKRTARAEDYDLWFKFYVAGFRGENIEDVVYIAYQDMASIRKRTFKSRWRSFQITVRGYKALGFPKRWLIKPFCKTAVRSIAPAGVQRAYRNWQHKG